MLISACIIAKNEAEHLPATLDHFNDLVDEFCVLDTGSTDGTLDITHPKLRIMKSPTLFREQRYPDDFDFAAARNEASDMATGEWIFRPDAEYRMAANNAGMLRDYIASEDAKKYDAIECMVSSGQETVPQCLFFRRSRGFRFVNPVHERIRFETVQPPVKIKRHDGFRFVHLRTTEVLGPEEWAEKRRWYLKLIMRHLESHNDDLPMHTCVLQELVNLQWIDEAVKCANYILALWGNRTPVSPGIAHVRSMLAICHITQGRYKEAEVELKTAMTYAPNTPRLRFLLGETYRLGGDFDKAEYWFNRAMSSKNRDVAGGPGDVRFHVALPLQGLDWIRKQRERLRCS